MTTPPTPPPDPGPDPATDPSGSAGHRGCSCECRCGSDPVVVRDTPDQSDPIGSRLRDVAALLDGRDRAMGLAARHLVALIRADGLHDRLGGMTLQVWLEHVGRLCGVEARALFGAIDVLARMPRMLTGLCDGWLSFSQVAAICRAARRVPVRLLAELDGLVGDAMVAMADHEPDAIVADVWQWIDTHRPTRLEREEAAAARSEFVALQPRLTGGGSLFGELGPISFATVAEAVSPATPPRAPDTELDALHAMDPSEQHDAYETLDERARAHTRDHGAATAARLVDLCDRALGGGPAGDPSAATDEARRRARPMVIATIDLDALCDASRTPGWLLHTVAGGRMKLSAAALQRLVDERGADLRGVVLDDCGEAVGVGRTTRRPPGWLRQAIWARDVGVRDPDGSTPIRRADLDHVTAWPDGATDATNLLPLGRRWHNHKTSGAWDVARRADGTTTWTHRRHGWVLRLAPPGRELTRPPRAGPPPAGPDGERATAPPRSDPDGHAPTQPRLTGVP